MPQGVWRIYIFFTNHYRICCVDGFSKILVSLTIREPCKMVRCFVLVKMPSAPQTEVKEVKKGQASAKASKLCRVYIT
jgi:hypothetical protein